jgi:ABC-type transport system involved in cytochrome c biogenesis permease component
MASITKAGPLEIWLDRIGDYNPQLMRELSGRLKPGPVLMTLAASIVSQGLYVLIRLSQIPSLENVVAKDPARPSARFHQYCLGVTNGEPSTECIPLFGADPLQPWQINWPLWWSESLFYWGLFGMMAMIVVGCYLLIDDWSTEEENGTFAPLRLSPQPNQTIIWGKLLGVPILVYLFGLLSLPLKLVAMSATGQSVSSIMGNLSLSLAQMAFWFVPSLLFAAICRQQGRGVKAIVGAIVSGLAIFYAQSASNMAANNDYRQSGESTIFSWLAPSIDLQHGGQIGTDFSEQSLILAGLVTWSSVCWIFLNAQFGLAPSSPPMVTTVSNGALTDWERNSPNSNAAQVVDWRNDSPTMNGSRLDETDIEYITTISRSPNPRLESIFNVIGNINPQLLRELRGRLRPGFIPPFLAVSFLFQLSSLATYYPSTNWRGEQNHGALWWATNLAGWNWVTPIAIVVGCYLLIADWSTEEERGTLNGIRLSPRPAGQILLGKLLGVPIWVYIPLLSLLPLHLVMMMGTGRSPVTIASSLAISAAQMAFWFVSSLLFAALTGKGKGAKAILGALIVGGVLFCSQQVGNTIDGWSHFLPKQLSLLSPNLFLVNGSDFDSNPLLSKAWLKAVAGQSWFEMGINSTMTGLTLFTVGNLTAWCYNCWIALSRRFNGYTTLWSKRHVYLITAWLTILVLGSIQLTDIMASSGASMRSNQLIAITASSIAIQSNGTIAKGFLTLFALVFCLGLGLVQSRQVLLDWMRRPPVRSGRLARKFSHTIDMVWGEDSPPIVAMALQIGISIAGIALLLISSRHTQNTSLILTFFLEQKGALGVLLLASLLMLMLGVTQLIQLQARHNAIGLATVAIVVGIFSLPLLLTLGLDFSVGQAAWLLTVYPFEALMKTPVSFAIGALCLEWVSIVIVFRQFDRTLRRLAKSEFADALEPISPQEP